VLEVITMPWRWLCHASSYHTGRHWRSRSR
jgi:hypothetical protein